jgi:hypothetical protein
LPLLVSHCTICKRLFQYYSTSGERPYCSHTCRRKKVDRICEICGKIFKVKPSCLKKGQAKYCSNKCHGSVIRTGKEVTCLTCSKLLYLNLSKLKNGRGKYCSDECRYKNTSVGRQCQSCDKLFRVTLTKVNRGFGKYCSRTCSNNGRTTSIEIQCETCGQLFYRQPNQIERSGGRFCSRTCHNRGLTALDEKIRKCDQYREWHTQCFERDNYTCQKCGDYTSRNLNVHHIKEFMEILKENNIITLQEAQKCKGLWDINNGITVCIDCHTKITRLYIQYKKILGVVPEGLLFREADKEYHGRWK